MRLYHATTTSNLNSILEHGLLVSRADSSSIIKGCWMATAGNRAWGVVHTMRKHRVALDQVVVIEVSVPRGRLTRFRTGLWYSGQDVPAHAIKSITPGANFGASAQ